MAFKQGVFPRHYTVLTFQDLVRLIDHADAVTVNGHIATTTEASTRYGIYLEYTDKETQLQRSCVWQKDDSLNIWITPSDNTIKVSSVDNEHCDVIKLLVFMKL
jgi:hypothetical protein